LTLPIICCCSCYVHVARSTYSFFCSLLPRPPTPTLFPYTTLFRSQQARVPDRRTAARRHRDALLPAQSRQIIRQARHRASRCRRDRKSTRLNSSHQIISYAVFCLKKKKKQQIAGDDVPAT